MRSASYRIATHPSCAFLTTMWWLLYLEHCCCWLRLQWLQYYSSFVSCGIQQPWSLWLILNIMLRMFSLTEQQFRMAMWACLYPCPSTQRGSLSAGALTCLQLQFTQVYTLHSPWTTQANPAVMNSSDLRPAVRNPMESWWKQKDMWHVIESRCCIFKWHWPC